MRGLALVCVLAACGDSGLLLDVTPGSKDVRSVEVFVPMQKQGDSMGMPPANSPTSTQGPVFEVIDTVQTPVDSDGRARILLKPGSIDQVPALLVLGYNANHEAIRYAVVQDPNGPIMLRHTQSDTIVVALDPAKSTSVGTARMPAGATPRIVRWSAAKMGDDLNGPCVGVIEDGDQGVKGTFFGPHDDLDCDAATPECDDNWYLRVEGAGHCVTDMIANDPLMGACRLGTTAGCVDNNANSGVCAPLQQVVCAPSTFCTDCSDRTLEMSGCLANTAMSDQTAHIDCEVTVADNGNGTGTLCDNKIALLDLATQQLLGAGWGCNAIAGFTSTYIDANSATPLTMLPLKGATNVALGLQCHADTTVLQFGVGAPAGAPVADIQQETWGGMVFGVHQVTTTGDGHFLVLPVHVTYAVGTCPTDATPTLSCTYSQGSAATPNGDTIWNCGGVTR